LVTGSQVRSKADKNNRPRQNPNRLGEGFEQEPRLWKFRNEIGFRRQDFSDLDVRSTSDDKISQILRIEFPRMAHGNAKSLLKTWIGYV